ncbi:MAG: N-acetyltransferase [Rhodothermales bacterium]
MTDERKARGFGTYREATANDLPVLAALDRDVFGHEAYPPFFFRQALDLWGPTFLVAETEARPVAGYALSAPSACDGEACILSMATHPSCRGQGLATGLLGALLDRLDAAGTEVVWLTVHPQNAGAVHLYRGAGFVAVAEEAAYFGPGEPRVRMERRLG